jgi:hypothetical protein
MAGGIDGDYASPYRLRRPDHHAGSVLPKRVGKPPSIVARIPCDKFSNARGVLQA